MSWAWSMLKMASNSEELKTFEELLAHKPSLAEVCEHVRTTRWFQLGVQLGLDEIDLEEIEEDRSSGDEKRTSVYQLWFRTQPKATRGQLLTALKSTAVGEYGRVAKGYENILRKKSLLSSNNSYHDDIPSMDILDTTINDIHITKIAAAIINWESLPLGLKQSDIEAIKRNYPSDYSQQKIKSLYKWRQMNESQGTYRQLISIVSPISKELAENIGSLIDKDISVIDKEDMIPVYDWDECISDEMIWNIAHVMILWEELSIPLGLSKSEQVIIAKDYKGDYNAQKRQILFKWREKQGQSAATYRALVKILTEIEDNDLAEHITKMIK